jgi:hypothetical protein
MVRGMQLKGDWETGPNRRYINLDHFFPAGALTKDIRSRKKPQPRRKFIKGST